MEKTYIQYIRVNCHRSSLPDLVHVCKKGQIQGQRRGQQVIKPKRVLTKKSIGKFGKLLMQFPFQKHQFNQFDLFFYRFEYQGSGAF